MVLMRVSHRKLLFIACKLSLFTAKRDGLKSCLRSYLTWPLTSAAMSRFVLGSEAFTYRTAGQADYLTYEMETRKWRPRVIEKVPGSAQ